MNRVSVQVGPRTVGTLCASWGQAIAREMFIVRLAFAAMTLEAALAVVFTVLLSPAPAPVFVPTAFCPAGQHVVHVNSLGWPDCAPDR